MNVFLRCALLALMFVASPLWAGFDVQSTGANGYDVVAYQTDHKAVKGDNAYYSFVKGVTYLFASADHKKQFDANPQKYLPAYGGYCAMAMTKGKKHLTSPDAFLVYQGKLYLNKADARPTWLKDVPGHIKKADKIWKKLKDTDPSTL